MMLDALLASAGVDVAAVGARLRAQDVDTVEVLLQMNESRLLHVGLTMGVTVRLMTAIEQEQLRRAGPPSPPQPRFAPSGGTASTAGPQVPGGGETAAGAVASPMHGAMRLVPARLPATASGAPTAAAPSDSPLELTAITYSKRKGTTWPRARRTDVCVA
jgi:hypothetical protein